MVQFFKKNGSQMLVGILIAFASFGGGLFLQAYDYAKKPSSNEARIEVVEKDVVVLKNKQENNVSKEWMKSHVKESDEKYAKKDDVTYVKETVGDIKSDMKIIKEYLINKNR